MKTRLGATVFFLLLSCYILTADSRAWGAGDIQPGVILTDGMLSVSVKDVPLGSLMDDVAKKAKITVFIADEVKGMRVSSRYSGLSLKNGLIRILEDAGINNYLLVYRDNDQKMVSELFVMKSDKASPGSSVSPGGRLPNNSAPRPFEMPGTRVSPPPPPPPVDTEEYPVPVPFEPVPGAQEDEMPPISIPMPVPFPPGDAAGGGVPQPLQVP